mmetsp:Transcript_14176/g.35189  ORF Transcript_14176/g.35189 Transcript_14176/m.35189 type:complete len:285 (+) Transcript_14176:216-1070(+)|eukprot:CAMPEP_0178993312 /NCGR_PEP_ID=MMETSP0795-20121207/6634_1 /TAXON_ID=88552 /ORGANISM="Amoebophrya sp., Strain Ameob2" /LENGTH=284 /DNA_ID=CAMNT_0020685359 /DNA_START=196 /DNA_END=1050 /DNA_ORIENTATION=+
MKRLGALLAAGPALFEVSAVLVRSHREDLPEQGAGPSTKTTSRTAFLEQQCRALGYILPNPCHCHCPNCPDPNYAEPAACPPATPPPPPPLADRPDMPAPDELAPLPAVPEIPQAVKDVHLALVEDVAAGGAGGSRRRSSEDVDLAQTWSRHSLALFCGAPPDPRECNCKCPPCDYWEPKLPTCTYDNERLCTQLDVLGNKQFVCFVPQPGWGKPAAAGGEKAAVEAGAAGKKAAEADLCNGDPALLPDAKIAPPIENSAPVLAIPEKEPPKIGAQYEPQLKNP